MKLSIFVLIAAFSLPALAEDPEMRTAKGYVDAHKQCHQRQDPEACTLKQRIGDYNSAVEDCNERGFFGGQSEASIAGCAKARKIFAEGGIELADE